MTNKWFGFWLTENRYFILEERSFKYRALITENYCCIKN